MVKEQSASKHKLKNIEKNKIMNQYTNTNPEDKTERLARFQIHRKTALGEKKAYFQAMLLLPAALRKQLDWEKGDILALKVVGGKTLQIRKVNIKNPAGGGHYKTAAAAAAT